MMQLPLPCVLDASAGIKLFLPENHSRDIQTLFEAALSSEEVSLHVPDLFYVECANVLWKKVRRGEYPDTLAIRNLARLQAMGLPTTSTSQLVARALELACLQGTSVYDACYAALAELLGYPLLTADARLAGLLSASGIRMIVLGE